MKVLIQKILNSEPKDFEFRSKNTFQKLWFLSAGVLMNFLLSIVIFTFLYFFNGTYELSDEPIINSVSEVIELPNPNQEIITFTSPAYELGLKQNDRILEIDGIKINTWSDISSTLVEKADSIVEIIWKTEFGSQKKVLLNYLEDHHLMERKLLIKVF